MAQDNKTIYKNLTALVVLFIILLAAGAYFLIKPKYDELSGVRASITREEDNLQKRQAELASIKQLLASYLGAKEQLQNLSLVLPDKKEVPSLVVELEALSGRNGLVMESLSYKEEKPPAQAGAPSSGEAAPGQAETENPPSSVAEKSGVYSTLNIEVSLTGRYDSFLNYLEDVRQNIRFLDVVSVSFTPGTKESKGEENPDYEALPYTFKVSMRTYYLE